ncbi:DUF7935 family protein [Aureibacter tunicatorum]|uniref:DUF4760 domain-containing protein n=1 Tax=Aureibacter tunicatorum TaxID=866807 RepID=A0AAE4BSS1_9BACT|nr:hypothetical protein [Aureibacter tunicatorum]MDR6238722.1 hypothetical protein [Aureibacter tunicatorum]BDD05347.1 hypothetical protein AUTU_28300 [Aureibacter tunicatorum]
METALDIIKTIIPAAIVVYAMYLTVKQFLNKDFEKKLADLKIKSTEQVITNRLQAYERMCLYLERISPSNIISRSNKPNMSVQELQFALINDIREEFNYNLSQQLYISDEAWEAIRNVTEEVILEINHSGQSLDKKASGIELAKKLIENWTSKEIDPIHQVLMAVKAEVRTIF